MPPAILARSVLKPCAPKPCTPNCDALKKFLNFFAEISQIIFLQTIYDRSFKKFAEHFSGGREVAHNHRFAVAVRRGVS